MSTAANGQPGQGGQQPGQTRVTIRETWTRNPTGTELHDAQVRAANPEAQQRVRVVGQNGGQRSRSFIGNVTVNAPGGQTSGRFLPNAGESSGRASAGDSLTRAVQALMSIQIHDHHDLFEFLNAGREVGHTLAIYIRMGAEELSAQMKAAERSKSSVSVLGPGARVRIRQTVREINKAGDSFADGAKHSAAAWRFFLRNFADDLSRAKTPARQTHRGFQIT